MSTVILNTSGADSSFSSTTKSLKTIDVDDVKKQYQSSTTSKNIQVEVYDDGKEVEVESEPQEQSQSVLSTEQQQEAQLDSYEEIYSAELAEQDAETELFNSEMGLALEHVRKLALFQKEALVNSIADTFASYNGREASVNDLSAILGRLKTSFAEEAEEAEEEEIYDALSEQEQESDSDYHPNDDSFDYELDQDVNENDNSSDGDAEDDSYDPNDDAELGEADLEEDLAESSASAQESEQEAISYDEEAIINSEEFDTLYFESMECVVNAAKLEKERIYAKISKKYQSEFGDAVIEEAFEQFVDFAFEAEEEEQEQQDDEDEQPEEESEDESEEVDVTSTEYRSQMDSALDNVRSLAASHKEAFVDEVCAAFADANGAEPSSDELSSLFSAIKAEFSQEARNEFLEDIEEESASEEEAEEEQEQVNVDWEWIREQQTI